MIFAIGEIYNSSGKFKLEMVIIDIWSIFSILELLFER